VLCIKKCPVPWKTRGGAFDWGVRLCVTRGKHRAPQNIAANGAARPAWRGHNAERYALSEKEEQQKQQQRQTAAAAVAVVDGAVEEKGCHGRVRGKKVGTGMTEVVRVAEVVVMMVHCVVWFLQSEKKCCTARQLWITKKDFCRAVR